PQPTYTDELLWVTGYRGFAEGQVRKTRIPLASIAAYPAAAALWIADAATGRNAFLRDRPDRVRLAEAFDDRFDRFWERIRATRDRLQAVRNRATLAWRFALEPRVRPPLVLTLDEQGELAGYTVLVRRDDPRRGLRRAEVADL